MWYGMALCPGSAVGDCSHPSARPRLSAVDEGSSRRDFAPNHTGCCSAPGQRQASRRGRSQTVLWTARLRRKSSCEQAEALVLACYEAHGGRLSPRGIFMGESLQGLCASVSFLLCSSIRRVARSGTAFVEAPQTLCCAIGVLLAISGFR